MTVVYETATLAAARGGTVALRLLVLEVGATTEIRIDRKEHLPHKALSFVVLRICQPTRGIEPLARAMTTIVHELERLHRQGYSLRERAGGGWRGAWHCDLLVPRGAPAVASWEIELRKPGKTLEPLARVLASLDVPAPRIDRSGEDSGILTAAMREHGDEVARHHAIDALIASDPLVPADEFLEELEARGLLAPKDNRGRS